MTLPPDDRRPAAAPPPDEAVYDLVGSSFEQLRMTRPLEQITARGAVLRRRRRTAVPVVIGVAAAAALTAVAAVGAIGPAAAHTVPQGAAADGSPSPTASPAPSADPLDDPPFFSLARGPKLGYTVSVGAIGDVAKLNSTLKALGYDVAVDELVDPVQLLGKSCSDFAASGQAPARLQVPGQALVFQVDVPSYHTTVGYIPSVKAPDMGGPEVIIRYCDTSYAPSQAEQLSLAMQRAHAGAQTGTQAAARAGF
jgi:hypothetical protein